MIEHHPTRYHRRQRLRLLLTLFSWPMAVVLGLMLNDATGTTGFPSLLCLAWLMVLTSSITQPSVPTR